MREVFSLAGGDNIGEVHWKPSAWVVVEERERERERERRGARGWEGGGSKEEGQTIGP